MTAQVRADTRSQWITVALLFAAASIIGGLAQVADGYQELSEVASRGGIWFAMLAAVGVTSPTIRSAAWRAIGFGAMSLVGYYAMTAIDSGWSPPWMTVWFWSGAAVTLAPIVSALSYWTWRGGHRVAWLGFGVGGGLLLGEATDVLLGDSSRRFPSFAVALIAGVTILIAGAWRTRRPGPVLWVALSAIPLGLLALRVLEAVYRSVIGGGLGSWL